MKPRPLVANALAMLAARLSLPAFSFAVNVAVGRLWGAEGLGAYVQLLALFTVFQAVAGAGLTPLLSRELAADAARAPRLLPAARTLSLITGAGAALAFLACAAWTLPPARLPASAFLAVAVLLSGWTAVQEARFIAALTHRRVTRVAILENVTRFTGAVAALLAKAGLAGLCAAISLGRAVALVVGGRMLSNAAVRGGSDVRGESAVRGESDVRGALALARQLAPFALLLVASILYFRVDVLLVEARLGTQATGLYGAALAICSLALLLPDSGMAAVYPRLAARFGGARGGYAEVTLLAARLAALGMTLVALGLSAVALPLVAVVYGGRFAPAGDVLRLLALTLPLHGFNAAIGQALQAARLQGAILAIVAATLATHIVLTWVLLPSLGLAAPVASLVASSALLSGGAAWLFHRKVAPLRLGRQGALAVALIVGSLIATTLAPPRLVWVAGLSAALLLCGAAAAAGFGRDLARLEEALRPPAREEPA